jgi:pimeloyl-ACP methyl ester carboxylesterase
MNKYYRKVPHESLEQFKRFRKEHQLKQTEINGTDWEYILTGDSAGQPLLLLPGGLSTAESAWRLITLLDTNKYHLICPSYPASVDTMTALADGITEILKREDIQTTYVVGGAYGSMLAQVFVHRHPDMVTRLVLTHAYPPAPKRVNSVDSTLRLFRLVPMFMVKNMLRAQMTGQLPANPSPELLLIAAQIHETLDTRLTRQAALNIYIRMVDFDQQNFTFTDLDSWQGKTLIILAKDDPTTTEQLRNELLALYPGALLHMLEGSVQTTALLETGEYIRVMEGFFEGTINSSSGNKEDIEKK